ncbi:hypothetical protein DERP_009230 [Dermatophagoides pteronyssinus]|uniref:Uncharacterized protein n=1 Tax=Dermatophagoides pteronyssinus TaxID=6956 RepID=A0ABQ8JRK5_DERPT|nr:hypothetical protein DERP_009230 [Dermatophagoides pteronyssinus]
MIFSKNNTCTCTASNEHGINFTVPLRFSNIQCSRRIFVPDKRISCAIHINGSSFKFNKCGVLIGEKTPTASPSARLATPISAKTASRCARISSVLFNFSSHVAFNSDINFSVSCNCSMITFSPVIDIELSNNIVFKRAISSRSSPNADITLPNVVNDLLILAPSFNRVPCAPVESARSDPAKSTKEIFDTFSDDKPVR